MISIEISSLKDINHAARSFISLTGGRKKFAFYGEMGSGKTTFIRAICMELGASSLVTSPTFSLVNEYHMDNGDLLYHFDLYRINDTDELFDIGFEEYFDGDHFVFIEWAEKAEALLPYDAVKVTLTETSHNQRLVSIAL
jgi:tRNA threonylcarbamoyladenosine biosynthesis protein TsaE